jgi:alkanesulfonate monooxygenase SsuD/methylene tetrahydromethanopterin reductase-like flavin-dependent oxidoreductase (luciferase family)
MKISLFSVVDFYPGGAHTRQQLYADVIEQGILADQLRFDGVWVAEHHFVDYGIVPNPAVLLAHLAAKTKHVRLGTAVSILPFRDPRQVAEDYVMLDMVSSGRAMLGVGSGYVAPEYAGFNLDFTDKHARFEESLGVVRKLIAGERVTLDGRFSTLHDVGLNVTAVQQQIPISVATGNKDTVRSIGRQGDSLMFMTYTMCNAMSEVQGVVARYREALAESGYDPSSRMAATGLHTHVGSSDAEARGAVIEAFDRYGSTRVKARKRSYEQAVGEGVVLFGSPSTVADQLVALHGMGIDEVLTLHNFGDIDASAAQASMKLLMNEVMPRVRERIAKVPA